MRSPTDENTEVLVNPYTGSILGSRLREKTFSDLILKLHYELLVGRVGETIVGIAALLLLLLSATGIVL